MTTTVDIEVPGVDAAPAEVFEFVYDRYQRRITWYVFNQVRDWATAEDLTAELFSTLWLKMSQQGYVLDNPERAYTLLVARARWTVCQHFNSAYQRHSRLMEFGGQDSDRSQLEALAAALTTDGPEATVISRTDLRRVIALLPDPQQRAILMRYLLDMAPDQIAEFTGWPPHKVTFYTTGALSALRATPEVAESLGRDPHATTGPVARRVKRKGPFDFSPALAARHQATNEGRERAASLIQDLIEVGNLPAGTRLPSTRQLAERCKLSKTSMAEVMAQLVDRGTLMRDGAKRYCVAGQEATPAPTRCEHAVEKIREHITNALASGELTPGQPVPNQVALSALCEVSTATVRNALNRLHATRFLALAPTGRYLVAGA